MERICFTLKHMEKWRLQEIAEELDVAVNSIKQAVFRAVRKLREEHGRMAERVMITDDDLILFYYGDELDADTTAQIEAALRKRCRVTRSLPGVEGGSGCGGWPGGDSTSKCTARRNNDAGGKRWTRPRLLKDSNTRMRWPILLATAQSPSVASPYQVG